jgi:hypothetical protein
VLVLVGDRAFTWNIGLAALMIVGAALLGTRAKPGASLST